MGNPIAGWFIMDPKTPENCGYPHFGTPPYLEIVEGEWTSNTRGIRGRRPPCHRRCCSDGWNIVALVEVVLVPPRAIV